MQPRLPPLYLMGSNGGILEAAEAIAMPAMAVESGPAAGVVAAALVARQTGTPNLLSFDMGGTTAKASLIRDGQYETTPEYEVGGGSSMTRWMNGTGHPIRVPVIDLAEVSAGGGSIAWVDRAGALRVGPKSAGADPGPGLLRPRRQRADGHRLQSAARLSRQGLAARRRAPHRSWRPPKPPCATGSPSRSALMCAPPRPPSSTSSTTPWRKCSRSYPCSAATIRAISCSPPSAERDRCMPPRSPSELGIAEVICPPIPGAFSALGLIGTDLKRDYVRTVYTHDRHRRSGATWRPPSSRSKRKGAAMLDRAGVAPERRRFERSVDARYARQSYELSIPVAAVARSHALDRNDCRDLSRSSPPTYGHDNRSEPVQIVSVRLAAIGTIPPLSIRDKPAPAGTDAVKSKRQLWFRDSRRSRRYDL